MNLSRYVDTATEFFDTTMCAVSRSRFKTIRGSWNS